MEAGEFVSEKGVGEGVGFGCSGWIAGQEGEGEGAIEEVAEGEKDGDGIRESEGKESGD